MASATASPLTEGVLTPLNVERLAIAVMRIEVAGVTPLIPHRWSEKATRMMFEKQAGRAKTKLPPKDPDQEAFDSCYWVEDDVAGMPATAFKAAIADAARFFDKSVTIEALKRAVFVRGEGPEQLVRVEGDREIFEAMPRNTGGTADLRYRYKIWPWRVTLEIEYIQSLLTPEALLNIVDAGGRNGVGDWRPSSPKSKTGTYGMFQVEDSSEDG